VLLVAVVGDMQAAFEVIVTETTSLFVKVVEVNVLEFVPAFAPFTSH
jgi:hypothetical protein